ncbi:hypothetical protein HZB78_00800 [Candidatus Collierbacteria bacterium]|nr:hypothetical protein [Candidatus Collierbacteria bacterium]
MKKLFGFYRLLILFGLSGLVYLGSKYLTIQTIKCQVDDSACPPDVFAELSRNYGQTVSGVRPSEIEAKLIKADFRLESVKVWLKFPLTLEANLKTRIPVIQIVPVKNIDRGSLIDANGRIIGQREIGDLPLVIWEEINQFQPGDDLPAAFVEGISIIINIYSSFSPEYIEISGRDIIFYLFEKTKVDFPISGSADKLETLQLLINQVRIGNQPVPKEIDLRFNYPVIKN